MPRLPSLPAVALALSGALMLGGPATPVAGAALDPEDGNLPDPTVRFRSLQQIAEAVVANAPPAGVVWCAVDADRTLRANGRGARWAAALAVAADARAAQDPTAGIQFGLYAVEDRGAVLLCPPTRDRRRFLDAFAVHCDGGADRYRDVMTALRAVATGSPGPAHVVLFSHTNVDGENDLEATLAALRQSKLTLSVVGRAAYLSDSYWAVEPPWEGVPSGVRLTGPEAPGRELPSGWIFDTDGLDNVAPAGWGLYAYARLCAATGGRYWIDTPVPERQTWCQRIECASCDGTHDRCDVPYVESYLGLMAPWRGSRVDYAHVVKRHPLWRAIAAAWEAAARAGAVRTLPPKLLQGDPGAPGPAKNPQFDDSFSGATWRGRGRDALEMAKALEGALRSLQAARAKVDRADAPRVAATAAVLEVQLAATAFNMTQFARFCEVVHRELSGVRGAPGDPTLGAKPAPNAELAWSWHQRSFCHGAAPLRAAAWLGGDAGAAELEAVATRFETNLAEVAGTPYATQMRHTCLAVFGMGWSVPDTAQQGRPPRGGLKPGPSTGTRTRGGRGSGGGSQGGGTSSGG